MTTPLTPTQKAQLEAIYKASGLRKVHPSARKFDKIRKAFL